MATCPRCGNKGLTLQTTTCLSCGSKGCAKCTIRFGSVPMPNGKAAARWACSNDCFDRWAFGQVANGYSLVASGPQWSLMGVALEPAFAGRVQAMTQQHQRQLALSHARNMLDAARYEDAARTYEGLGMFKEAGDTRRMAMRHVTTQVQVNMNDLLEQLRRMGISASYTCPVCRSPFSITGDTRSDALAKCQYCGAVIHPTDLVEAITKVVGYH